MSSSSAAIGGSVVANRLALAGNGAGARARPWRDSVPVRSMGIERHAPSLRHEGRHAPAALAALGRLHLRLKPVGMYELFVFPDSRSCCSGVAAAAWPTAPC